MFESSSLPTPIWAAIITASATVIVGILLLVLKKWYFDVQSRLRVEARASTYRTSEALKKTGDVRFGDPLWEHIQSKGYALVTITNKGKKKVSGVSLTAHNIMFDLVCQIDEAEEMIAMKLEKPITIGAIQPNHSRVVHIWSRQDISDYSFGPVKRLLRISADELDSVSLRFPMPRFLRSKLENRVVLTVTALAFAVFILSSFLQFYLR